MVPSRPVDQDLNTWVSESAQQALGYAWTLVRRQEVAEDLVQDCYRRLLARSQHYNLPRDGTKLLYRSITNACINWTQRHHSETSLEQIQQASAGKSQKLLDRTASEPIQIVMQRELEQTVEMAMNELSVEQRAAIELRSLGHSLVDVADMLNLSHGNARVILHRARTILAEKLRPYLEEDGQ